MDALADLAREAVWLSDLAHETLRRSESRYRRLFETAQDGILLLNADTAQIEDVNPFLIDMLGYSHAEFLGKKLWEVGPFADIAQSKEMFAELQAKGYVRYEDLPLKTKQGARIAVEFVSNAYDCEGIKIIQCNVRDISERRAVERILAVNQDRLVLATKAAGIGIWDWDIANDKLLWDAQMYALYGVRAQDFRGAYEAWMATIHPDDRPRAIAETTAMHAADGGLEYRSEFRVVWPNGEVHYIQACAAATRASNGSLTNLLGVNWDITRIARYTAQLKASLMSTVEVATVISEMRDPYTAGHERRVAVLAVAIGAEMGFDTNRQEGLKVAGYLHDVGKMSIPLEILAKPGRLTDIEMQLVQGHAQASFDILKGVEFTWPVAQVALQHHERMDGSGYPQGLKGEAIIVEARIMAVADVVEAMSSHRPYRPGLGIEKALAEIERRRGTAYDTQAVGACLRLFREKGYKLPAA